MVTSVYSLSGCSFILISLSHMEPPSGPVVWESCLHVTTCHDGRCYETELYAKSSDGLHHLFITALNCGHGTGPALCACLCLSTYDLRTKMFFPQSLKKKNQRGVWFVLICLRQVVQRGWYWWLDITLTQNIQWNQTCGFTGPMTNQSRSTDTPLSLMCLPYW